MCEQCDDLERSQFCTETDFELFEKLMRSRASVTRTDIVEGKLREPRWWLFGIIGVGTKTPEVQGHEIWTCSRCGQRWALSVPDYAWRGYFVRQTQNQN